MKKQTYHSKLDQIISLPQFEKVFSARKKRKTLSFQGRGKHYFKLLFAIFLEPVIKDLCFWPDARRSF